MRSAIRTLRLTRAFRELIVEALQRGRNATAIYQDLVDDHGFTARYASVRRFVATLRAEGPSEARVVIATVRSTEGETHLYVCQHCGALALLPDGRLRRVLPLHTLNRSNAAPV